MISFMTNIPFISRKNPYEMYSQYYEQCLVVWIRKRQETAGVFVSDNVIDYRFFYLKLHFGSTVTWVCYLLLRKHWHEYFDYIFIFLIDALSSRRVFVISSVWETYQQIKKKVCKGVKSFAFVCIDDLPFQYAV